MMKGTIAARMPIKEYFFPKELKAPITDWPVLRPRAVSSKSMLMPNVNTSTM
jgi:hypothetical protein